MYCCKNVHTVHIAYFISLWFPNIVHWQSNIAYNIVFQKTVFIVYYNAALCTT